MAETHIQIGDITPRIQYTGDGVQTLFTYPFPIFQAADMEVFLDNVKQATGFTVNGAGQSAGGDVTFDSAPGNGVVVTLRRRLAIQRTSDFQESGEFRSKVINDELDYLTAALQQVSDDGGQTLRLGATDAAGNMTLPDKAARLGKALTFDPVTGDPAATAFVNLGATVLSDANAQDTGTAAAGTSSDISRADHVHAIPINHIDETKLKDALIPDFTEVVAALGDQFLLGDAGDSFNSKRDTIQGIVDLTRAARVGTASATSVTTIDFDGIFTSAYTNYFIEGYLIAPETDDVDLWVRFDANGGASYDAGATDYHVSLIGQSNTASRFKGGNAAQAVMSWATIGAGQGIRSGANSPANFQMVVYTPLNSTYITQCIFKMGYHNSGTNWSSVDGQLGRTTNLADDSIQFRMSSGNFDAEIRVYGLNEN